MPVSFSAFFKEVSNILRLSGGTYSKASENQITSNVFGRKGSWKIEPCVKVMLSLTEHFFFAFARLLWERSRPTTSPTLSADRRACLPSPHAKSKMTACGSVLSKTCWKYSSSAWFLNPPPAAGPSHLASYGKRIFSPVWQYFLKRPCSFFLVKLIELKNKSFDIMSIRWISH